MAVNGIARWDGSAWSALGSGTNSTVNALLVFDDAGGLNVDAQGCGVLLPGIGDFLLTIPVGPLPLASGPAVGGVTSLSFTVPNLPQLVGLPIGLQGVHVALSVPGTPIEPSNALVGTFAP